CQSWKLAVAGTRVSVTIATGISWFFAAVTSAVTSGVEFWLLKIKILICLVSICLSTVILSAAVGSVPSLIASRNDSGVAIRKPRPSASGVTIDSEAPIGVPVYLALMSAMSWL